jgi:hypothetical protein
MLSVACAMAIGLCAAVAQAGLLVENFDSDTWAVGDNVIGKNGWQASNYYGSAGLSPKIADMTAGTIGGNGYGVCDPNTVYSYEAGASKDIGETYTSGVVRWNGKFKTAYTLYNPVISYLSVDGTTNADSVSFQVGVGSSNKGWLVERKGGSDVQAAGYNSPFVIDTWYELEMGVDLTSHTASVGYYTLNQTGLARTSGLNSMATMSGVQLASISDAAFFMNQRPNAYVDEIRAGVPEPSVVVLLITGVLGLLAYAWRKRK